MKNLILFVFITSIFACKNAPKNEDTLGGETEVQVTKDTVVLTKLWETEATLMTAESVLFDEVNGIYYVSCIGNVPPTKEDGDGYIAILDQRGNIVNPRWAYGLDAPKGMALSNGNLYVTDINEFVIISIETGTMQRIAIQGSEFLNDVALAPDGSVYFTDMGTNTIYRYADGKVSELLRNADLAGPNGIYVDENNIYLASFGSGNVTTIELENMLVTTRAEGAVPGGDGIAPWNDGLMYSNWNGEIYFVDSEWRVTKCLDTKADKVNAADIAINQKAGELLIPTFFANTVAAYKIN